jgi:hypothetical protein
MQTFPRSTEPSPESFDLIHSYTRAQALEDGVLVDVSSMARECGILWPVAVTAAVHARCVVVPAGVECQDEAGRLWDIVWMLRGALARAARRGARGLVRLPFALYVRNTNRAPKLVRLDAVVGPGDSGEPTVTVMFPDED